MDADPFDELLGLEDQFYNEGYELGLADGAKAGRTEGRAFGLEKGFEKYVESGRLYGKSLVWFSRLRSSSSQRPQDSKTTEASAGSERTASTSPDNHDVPLPRLSANPRLEKHIKVLSALAEPASLSTENTEDAVSDFDDRLKRAVGKAKIIEKMVGEEAPDSGAASASIVRSQYNGDSNIEEISISRVRS